jgi:hypothetical protein
MKRKALPFCIIILLSAAPSLNACLVHDAGLFTSAYKANPNDRLMDYGRIHMDAENPDCARAAMYALTAAVTNELWVDGFGRTTRRADAYRQWLDGYNVALIFAAAMRLGAQGWANKDLDDVLIGPVSVASVFQHTGQPNLPCAYGSFNTCMDDYAGTASGYAWMAAYKERRTPQSGGGFRTAAIDNVALAMSSVCIWIPHEDASGPLCNSDVAALRRGDPGVETLSVNQGQQQIPYGFGLMTSIAGAYMAINIAGGGYTLDDDQKAIATGLFAEAQKKIDEMPHIPGMTQQATFRDDCIDEPVSGKYPPTAHCGGGFRYKPNMYALRAFYDNAAIRVPGTPLVDWESNSFDPDTFQPDINFDGFFGWGRFVTYGYHGYGWWVDRPDFMPYDGTNPKGWFEAISPTGLAQGWACDRDTISIADKNEVRGLWIDFYADGDPFTVVAQGFADSESEDVINTRECGGANGTAHRFWIQLPPSTKGKTIRAYGLDYTWYGFTELPGGPHTW